MRTRPLGSLAALALFSLVALVAPWLPAADDDPPPGLVLTLKGHKEAVYGIAFTADGKYVITASGDPSVKVWETSTGKEIKEFGGANGHKGLILAVAMAPDGMQFATAGGDNSARIWDFPSSSHLREFAMTSDPRTVAVSSDGTKVAGGGKDGKIRLWNAEGKQLLEIGAHTGAVTGLTFIPNSQTLASVGADSTIRYWNVADGKALATFAGHPGAISSVSTNPGGNVLWTGGVDGTLRSWSQPPPGTKTLQAPFATPLTAMTLSPDGAQVAAASGKSVRLATLNTGATIREFAAPSDNLTSVATLSGGTLVAAGAADRKVYLWQNKDGNLLMQQPAHTGGVTSVAFNPAGNQLATVGKDGMLRVWTVPPTPTRRINLPDAVRASVLTSDGKRLATGGADKTIRLYKLDNLNAPERQLTGLPAAINALAFSADAKTLVSGGDDEIIRVWNLAKGEQTAGIGAHTGAITSLAYLPGERILSTGTDGSVKLWQAPTTTMPRSNFTHAGAVTSAVLSPDGTRLVTGCADKQVRSWNLANGQLERTWTGPTLGVLCVVVSPRGDRVAAGSADRTLHVFEAATSKVAHKLVNLPAAVNAAALTPDGKQAITGLADGSVRLHDLASGKEVKALEGHKGAVNALLLTLKGDQVVTGGADGVVLVRGLAAGPAPQTWKHGSVVLCLAQSRDGARVAVGGADKTVKVYTLATGKVEATITTPAEVRGVSFSTDGKKLAVAGGDKRARLYTLEGALEEYLAHDEPVNAVVFSTDGKRVLTASADKTARAWTPALIWQGRHEAASRQALLSPRGDRVVSAGDDGLVKSWSYADGKLLQSLRAHAGAVVGIGLSADASRLVSAGADKAARSWDLAKLPPGKMAGKDLDTPSATMTLPAGALSVSLTPNGQRAAIGLPSGTTEQVRVFDAATGKELAILGEDETMPGRTLTFLPDSRLLLAAGADKSVRLVDVNVVSAWEAHPGGCTGLAYHDNGTQILTGGADRTARLWTLATGKLERTFGPLAGNVEAFSLARGATQLATTSGKTLEVWNTADGKKLLSLEMPTAARSVSFNNDRTRIATAGEGGRVSVWDVALGREVQGFLHGAAATGVSFHPFTANQLVSSSLDRTLGIHTLSGTRTAVVGSPVNGLAVSPNLVHILTANPDGKVRLVNGGTGNVERICEAGDKATTCVAVSRSGQLIAAGCADRKVRVFNYNDGKLLSAFTTPSEPRAVSFSPTNQALVASGADGVLTAWDVVYAPGQPLPAEFGKVLQSYVHGKESSDVVFPGAGAIFYTAGADRTVKAWKLASDAPTRTFAHPNTVNALAYNKDGSMLITGAGDGRVRIFDTAKGTLLRDVNAHPVMNNEGAVYGVALSPDGKLVVSASKDQTLKLFNVADGKQVREFKAFKEKDFPKGHQDAVLCVAFSPDGTLLASGGTDRTIKIWNVADASVAKELVNPAYKAAAPGLPAPAHPGWVYALRWAEGGKKLISVGGAPRLRGYAAVWDTSTGKLVWGKEMGVGTIFTLGLPPDEKHLALGTGGSVRADRDLNLGLLLKMPK